MTAKMTLYLFYNFIATSVWHIRGYGQSPGMQSSLGLTPHLTDSRVCLIELICPSGQHSNPPSGFGCTRKTANGGNRWSEMQAIGSVFICRQSSYSVHLISRMSHRPTAVFLSVLFIDMIICCRNKWRQFIMPFGHSTTINYNILTIYFKHSCRERPVLLSTRYSSAFLMFLIIASCQTWYGHRVLILNMS